MDRINRIVWIFLFVNFQMKLTKPNQSAAVKMYFKIAWYPTWKIYLGRQHLKIYFRSKRIEYFQFLLETENEKFNHVNPVNPVQIKTQKILKTVITKSKMGAT